MVTYEVFILSVQMAGNTMGSAFDLMEAVVITNISGWDLTVSRFVLGICIGEELMSFYNDLYS